MLTVSGLYIYPIKSLAGIAIDSVAITSRGFQNDRRMMLVNEQYCVLTQREIPAMALLQPILENDGLLIHHKKNIIPPIFIPYHPAAIQTVMVTVWNDVCEGLLYDAAVNSWFSQALGITCSLVYMPDTTNRAVDKDYAINNEITSFADGYPTLIIGQASLDELNSRLPSAIPMNRFRPNIVFAGGDAFLEDQLQSFAINGIHFNGVKPCARCIMTTIDQDNIERSKEPLKTLATYRQWNNKILFGQNLLHTGDGIISNGDIIHVEKLQPAVI